MKKRTFKIYSSIREWNFSGLKTGKETYLTTIPDVLPTVKEIRSIVRSLFPEYEIDETDAPLSKCIHENLDIGMISVPLATHDMFISRSCVFMEVF